ncbi:hypothetical protein GJ744_002326 [Endocarpon pusillum]|uniref:Zn(2)-C6 fungal-type domain-containing protein n=1 Tax=Endocarpon pusillum TaxID=364733 RepID=A0A8H7ARE8_9EURO|nr:hypothetical protein GJ744_002326 [Endocarpon pusillum]
MESDLKRERNLPANPIDTSARLPQLSSASTAKGKSRTRDKEANATAKRRCVSTACIACRKRKSKCDGQLPKCAACASVYLTDCEYAPHTDHRRKGVYKKDIDTLKTRNSTLQTLIHAILNFDEEDVPELVRQIRSCENLEDLAESIVAKSNGALEQGLSPDSPVYGVNGVPEVRQFETELSGKMGDLRVEGSVKFIGGTSNLIWLPTEHEVDGTAYSGARDHLATPSEEAVLSWTSVTTDKDLISHLINMYFCWHYAYFTTLSKKLFLRDFSSGCSTQYCSALLVNVMLSLGCHFSTKPGAYANPHDSATAGDHFFKEAKRLMYENDEFAITKICTVQALALMSVREAGCGREGKGWVYSGMSFRMAMDLGLDVDAPDLNHDSKLDDEEKDARRITYWGCFLFDKCWSNYLGRQPQLLITSITTPKFDVFPEEESEPWSPYTDSGSVQTHKQPARTRAVALQISKLSELSSALLISFYHPTQLDKPASKQTELKKLSELHTRLEAWKRELPHEMEPRDGQLPQVLLMHMFFQLLFIHLYRPFLKYNRTTSPLPSHVSPRKYCTQAAGAISKLLRLYKRTYGLRQICNIAVYIAHSACTIHLLNLPDKNAKRDIIHGVKHLEEIGEMWTCARRTLRILRIMAEKWKTELPEEAAATFSRTGSRWGSAEPAPSPTLSDQSPGPSAQPVSGAMAHQSPFDQQAPMPLQATPTIPYLQNGFFGAPSPSDQDTPQRRRSSGNHSLPPRSAAELSRASNRVRPSLGLTKAQQDAWNAHQAARLQAHHNASTSTSASGTRSTDPTVLFGGVASLVEESQEWWLKDQASLAMGFNNWNDPVGGRSAPQQPWSMLGYDVPTTMDDNDGSIYGYGINDFS